jgi:transmembrane E3 ubiquitin-protein ligase
VLELRYVMVIWKARDPEEAAQDGRASLFVLYLRFYGLLVLGMVILYQMVSIFPLVLCIAYCYWVPQIVENTVTNAREALSLSYVYGITASRLAIPLYFYGCPDKFMTVQTNPALCVALCLLGLAQVGVLRYQSQYGGRAIIPKPFLPEAYDYFRALDPEMHVGPLDCAICTDDIVCGDHMVTPCEHVFHPHCLQEWLDQKLECPICRGKLPNVMT